MDFEDILTILVLLLALFLAVWYTIQNGELLKVPEQLCESIDEKLVRINNANEIQCTNTTIKIEKPRKTVTIPGEPNNGTITIPGKTLEAETEPLPLITNKGEE